MSAVTELLTQPLLRTWSMNADYGRQLAADLSDDQMVAQPHAGINHPAWLLSHLNLYQQVLAALLRGETPADPIDHKFGMKSAPVADASKYAAKDDLIAAWTAGHEAVASALQSADEALLLSPMPIERFRSRFATIGSCLMFIMIRHESLHLGQLSAWRRAMELPRV